MNEMRWYAVQTQPNSERKAVAHLARQGFETYLPRYLKRRRHARRIETVCAPLFPRYIFVGIDLATQRWRCVGSTCGVTRLVCNGDSPAAVPHGVVETIKAREDADGYLQVDQRPRFGTGDEVVIVDGAFATSPAIVEGASDKERVMVLLNLLGRKVRVSVEADLLTAA